MPLQLVLGPANCGKIALLLDRFLEAADADRDPFLIVPNRPDVESMERELVRRFQVSRGSVRDGIRTLELIGLVRSRQGEGTVVRELSADSLARTAVISALPQRLWTTL